MIGGGRTTWLLHTFRSAVVSAVILVAAGCGTTYSGIGATVLECCPEQSYETFKVDTRDIPAFLGPLMVSNFSVAFAAHGLQPVTGPADLNVLLRFESEDLTPPHPKDPFGDAVSAPADTRFAARIVVEVREAGESEPVWVGKLERVHDLGRGQVMHTGRASVAILDAFEDMLSEFPRTVPDYAR